MSKCVVSADLFLRAWRCVSKDECRYYLNGVSIEPCHKGGALLVATDGHQIIALRDPQGIVDAPMILKLSKPVRKVARKCMRYENHKTHNLIACDGKRAGVVIAESYADALAKLESLQDIRALDCNDPTMSGAKFPDWRRVISPTPEIKDKAPKIEEGKTTLPNMRLVNNLAEALGPLLFGFGVAAQLRPAYEADGRAAPLFVTVASDIDGFGVVMPKLCAPARDVPDWAFAAAAPAA